MTTVAPAWKRRFADSKPSPELAPVINTVLPAIDPAAGAYAAAAAASAPNAPATAAALRELMPPLKHRHCSPAAAAPPVAAKAPRRVTTALAF